MAIAKMKKIRIVAVRSSVEELLKELMVLGCVQVSEAEAGLQGTGLEEILKREDAQVTAKRSVYNQMLQALDILKRHFPKKSALLSAKPEVSAKELLDTSKLDFYREKSARIVEIEESLKKISSDESRINGLLEALKPWDSLNMDLGFKETETCSAALGCIPSSAALADVQSALNEVSQYNELFEVSSDEEQHYAVLIGLKEDFQELLDAAHKCGFTASPTDGMEGTARENALSLKNELEKCGAEKEKLTEELKRATDYTDNLKLASDVLGSEIAVAEAEDKMVGTENFLCLEGWMPEQNEAEVISLLDKYSCAYETLEPTEDEYADVPVRLDNNAVTDSMNMVTNMYSLPAYGSVDANPVMAPFFILFFGLMFADIGYGIIMIIAAIVAMKKMKPRGGTRSFCRLLLYCGISTTIAGVLSGGFFGDFPYQLVHIINPASTWKGLPALFNPLTDSLYVLIGAMVLGLFHLNAGMAVNFYMQAKKGNIKDAVFSEGAQWIILLGALVYGVKMLGVNIPNMVPLVIMAVGVVLLLYGSTRNAKGFSKITAPIGEIYNQATGWFGDILSYSRIMALMLAGSVIGQVFNNLATMPLKGAKGPVGTVIGVIAALLIFVVGHALNFGLNILGCFVHDLRLQCLEFFGKFYQDGGKRFEPLAFRTKYYNVAQQ